MAAGTGTDVPVGPEVFGQTATGSLRGPIRPPPMLPLAMRPADAAGGARLAPGGRTRGNDKDCGQRERRARWRRRDVVSARMYSPQDGSIGRSIAERRG